MARCHPADTATSFMVQGMRIGLFKLIMYYQFIYMIYSELIAYRSIIPKPILFTLFAFYPRYDGVPYQQTWNCQRC